MKNIERKIKIKKIKRNIKTQIMVNIPIPSFDFASPPNWQIIKNNLLPAAS